MISQCACGVTLGELWFQVLTWRSIAFIGAFALSSVPLYYAFDAIVDMVARIHKG